MKNDVIVYLKSLSDVPFELQESSDCSYTLNKKTIYLLLRDRNGEYYDWHTIITAALHEFAHVIDRHNRGHGLPFYSVLKDLETIATDKYGYRSNFPSDPEYTRVKNESCLKN
jgi:hypothetical protein